MHETVHAAFTRVPVEELLERLAHSWIGERCDPEAIGTIPHVNPADGSSLGPIDEAGAILVDRAVNTARAAFDGGWQRMPAKQRKQMLRRYAEVLTANFEQLAVLETLEVGRPISEALSLLPRGVELLTEFIEMIDASHGDLAGADDCRMAVSWHRPRGVVAAITPWNFPTLNVLMRLAPALAAGNTLVIKPSEYCSRSAVRLAQLAVEAGLPAGVVNVVTGTGQVTGKALAEHPGIHLITFTGSTRTARDILAAAAANSLKPVLLECGGKSPQVLLEDIFEDADIWAPIFFSGFWNSGQWCVARTRLLVPRSHIQTAIDGLQRTAAAWRIGDPRTSQTRLGPLASPQQYQRVRQYFDLARRHLQCVELQCPPGSRHPDGCYLEPHLIVVDAPADRLVQEEIFGPLMILQPYDHIEQALALANGTEFGLAATVWTNNAKAGYRLARHIDSGLIDVVTSSASVGEAMPRRHYEPRKQSGFGVEGGMAGLLAYTQAQSVTFRY